MDSTGLGLKKGEIKQNGEKMKNRLDLLLILLCLLSSCTSESHAKILIRGMVCADCKSRVETTLKSLPEVGSVQVDIASGTALVTLKKGTHLDQQKATDLLNQAGHFKVQKIEEL